LQVVCLFIFSLNAAAAPVPDTGQTKCYNTTAEIPCPSSGQPFYGQDACYTINRMSYTKLDEKGGELPDSAESWSMVKDNNTGLIWEMKTNQDGIENFSDPHDADNTYIYSISIYWPDTDGFLKSLNDAGYGGFSDWRLPDLHEINTIIDYGIPEPGPTIASKYFTNTVSSNYCSTTAIPYLCSGIRDAYPYRVVNFGSGNFDQALANYTKIYVRAVRSEKSKNVKKIHPDTLSLIESSGGNRSVTDHSTGLIWQSDTPSEKMNWEQALSYCENLDLEGYTDWRLPTIKEFRSLVNYENCSLDPSVFWTSTPDSNSLGFAWCAGYSNGLDKTCDMKQTNYVRAVRGGLGKCKPIIKANGFENQISITNDSPISVTVSLEPGDKTGHTADWWFVLDSPWGWYFQTASEFIQTPEPYYQSTPLFEFHDQQIIAGQLPIGDYTFYFGVYITPNNSTNSPLIIDSVNVHISQ